MPNLLIHLLLLLLLLLFLAAMMHTLPPARDALEPLPGLFVSDRGLVMPSLSLSVTGRRATVCVIQAACSPSVDAVFGALDVPPAAKCAADDVGPPPFELCLS